jgi:TonB-linked SusC/RagA family outer membrane protein
MKNLILLPFIAFSLLGTVNAQIIVKIGGTVSDDGGNPVSGVKVTGVAGKSKAVSDNAGQYVLEIDDESDAVTFSLPGYRSQTVALTGETEVNVELRRAEAYNSDETVFLGYSAQRKGNFTGSAATVTGEELKRSPTANLSQALTGRLAGLYTYESYSEPSRTNTTLRVRGANSIWANTPLIVIDGFPYSYDVNQLFEFISASDVESISVLKDASAQALYGIQGANGVIVVTTRRGVQGKLKVDVKIDQTFEQTSTRLPFIGSDEYVPLRNQAGYNDGLGRYNYFSEQEELNFISGENKELYPSNDWRKINMKDVTHMQRVNVDATGGNGRATFFTNFNVMHQDGMWKTDQTKYDPNNNFIWANFRTNVDVKLNRYLSAALNLSGNIKREKSPGSSSITGFADGVYYRLYTVPSYVYGPVTPRVVDPATGEVLDEGGGVTVTVTEPYSAYSVINRLGYAQHTLTNIYAQFALKLDLNFLAKGLDLSGYMGYQTNSASRLYNQQTFTSWLRTGGYDELEFVEYGNVKDTPLQQAKGSHFYYNLNYKGILNYSRSFGRHHVGGMAYAMYQNLNTADGGSPALLPYMRINSGVEAVYDYDRRYLVKLDMGYSGSEQYAKERRFTATPAISAGWVVSGEPFMENAGWLSLLKLRASYGKTANDRSNLGRYIYLDNITLQQGGPLGYLQYFAGEGQSANPYLTPEISVKQNYGIDLSFWDNLAISADIFRERMENMVAGGVSITPEYQGIPLNYFPRVNSGIFENKGYELTVDYTKTIGKDLCFNAGGWLAYTKNRVIYSDESERAEDFAYRKRTEGFPVGQEFGYIVDYHNGNGYFNSRQEIDDSNLTYEIGNPRVGDLKYYDLNNDGIINDKDKAPLGVGSIPRYVYAFHANARYKCFDLSVLFQGVADFWQLHMATGRVEYSFDGVFSEWHKNAWTAERYAAGEKITYPTLSAKKNSNHEANSFFLEDKSYLRLKNVEIGFTFPEKIAKAIAASNIRFYLSGQNLFTWHKLTTKEYGPEGNYLTIPVYRLYNVGLSVKF